MKVQPKQYGIFCLTLFPMYRPKKFRRNPKQENALKQLNRNNIHKKSNQRCKSQGVQQQTQHSELFYCIQFKNLS